MLRPPHRAARADVIAQQGAKLVGPALVKQGSKRSNSPVISNAAHDGHDLVTLEAEAAPFSSSADPAALYSA